MTLLSDPVGLLILAFGVAIVGLSKGGLSGMGALSLPLMSLVVSPVQSAAILLPLLLISDAISLWQWWGKWRVSVLRVMLPGALFGIFMGWLLAAQLNDNAVRMVVGTISVGFALRWFGQKLLRKSAQAVPENWLKGSFWGVVSGFTSMVSHSGGPPYAVYTLPLQMPPAVTTSTSVAYFSIINTLKVLPYFLLGQFSAENLSASIILAPVAIGATFLGAWIIRRLKMSLFYTLMYATLFAVGVKLFWDGARGLIG